MREKAEAATPGPWVAEMYDVLTAHEAAQVADCFDDAEPNAEHIASWHPAVALAVADWLEEEADAWSEEGGDGLPYFRAYMVAVTYLGTGA